MTTENKQEPYFNKDSWPLVIAMPGGFSFTARYRAAEQCYRSLKAPADPPFSELVVVRMKAAPVVHVVRSDSTGLSKSASEGVRYLGQWLRGEELAEFRLAPADFADILGLGEVAASVLATFHAALILREATFAEMRSLQPWMERSKQSSGLDGLYLALTEVAAIRHENRSTQESLLSTIEGQWPKTSLWNPIVTKHVADRLVAEDDLEFVPALLREAIAGFKAAPATEMGVEIATLGSILCRTGLAYLETEGGDRLLNLGEEIWAGEQHDDLAAGVFSESRLSDINVAIRQDRLVRPTAPRTALLFQPYSRAEWHRKIDSAQALLLHGDATGAVRVARDAFLDSCCNGHYNGRFYALEIVGVAQLALGETLRGLEAVLRSGRSSLFEAVVERLAIAQSPSEAFIGKLRRIAEESPREYQTRRAVLSTVLAWLLRASHDTDPDLADRAAQSLSGLATLGPVTGVKNTDFSGIALKAILEAVKASPRIRSLICSSVCSASIFQLRHEGFWSGADVAIQLLLEVSEALDNEAVLEASDAVCSVLERYPPEMDLWPVARRAAAFLAHTRIRNVIAGSHALRQRCAGLLFGHSMKGRLNWPQISETLSLWGFDYRADPDRIGFVQGLLASMVDEAAEYRSSGCGDAIGQLLRLRSAFPAEAQQALDHLVGVLKFRYHDGHGSPALPRLVYPIVEIARALHQGEGKESLLWEGAARLFSALKDLWWDASAHPGLLGSWGLQATDAAEPAVVYNFALLTIDLSRMLGREDEARACLKDAAVREPSFAPAFASANDSSYHGPDPDPETSLGLPAFAEMAAAEFYARVPEFLARIHLYVDQNLGGDYVGQLALRSLALGPRAADIGVLTAALLHPPPRQMHALLLKCVEPYRQAVGVRRGASILDGSEWAILSSMVGLLRVRWREQATPV